MAIDQLQYGLDTTVYTTGSLGIGNVKDEGYVRFVIENAGFANVVRVRGRLVGQTSWDILANITGSLSTVVEVLTYDQIEVIVMVYSASSSNGVKITASSYTSTSLHVSVPEGTDIVGANVIEFTSSDDSIIITGDNSTGVIDLVAVGGGGGGTPPHTESFIVGDWINNVDSYIYTVLEADHDKGINPSVEVYEDVAGNFEEVETGIEVNSSGDITISVLLTPDLRFSGKIVIN